MASRNYGKNNKDFRNSQVTVIIRGDYCFAQNKNWTPYTSFIYQLFNPTTAYSSAWRPSTTIFNYTEYNSITLDYFEQGHTSMAEMLARKHLYDFYDLFPSSTKKAKGFTFYVSKMSSAHL